MCCDIPPAPWWLAVEEELKTGYLTVLKCLSKNKKACDILKWSPKKRTSECVCKNGVRARTLRFSESISSGVKSIRDSDNKCLSKDICESKQNEVVSNFSDCDLNENDALNLSKLHNNNHLLSSSNLLRVNVESSDCQGFDGLNAEKNLQFSPHATQSDSGIGSTDDELKASSSIDEESNFDERSLVNGQCFCSGLETWAKAAPTLLSIKKKVNCSEYSSLLQFHEDVESVINAIIGSEDLTKVYHQTIKEVFPWFDPKGFKVYDSHSSCDVSMDDSLDFETSDIIDNNKDEVDENIKSLLSFEKDHYYLCNEKKDNRICILCKNTGEGLMFEEGRLLYCGHNEWIHSNCALWSSEVFEEIDGSLQNVHSAISRGKMIRCSKCSKKGASIGCCSRNCVETYHFPCARLAHCTFLENKTIYCQQHSSNTLDPKVLTKEEEFHISRPVYVELERKRKKFVDYQSVVLAVGSLQVHHLGKFEPKVSDTHEAIIPIEFYCSRLFWSAVEPWKLVPYFIKTNMLSTGNEYDVDSDHNYTVDHSIMEESSEQVNLAICEVVSLLCDSICAKEEEANAEAQTNVNDLLSEQETIFEDLPNEFFDGVFKDICSKMMSIEDLVAAGDKDDSNQSDSDANNQIEMSEDDSQNCGSDTLSLKKTCFEFNSLPNNSICDKLPKPLNALVQPLECSKNKLSNKHALCKDLLSGSSDDTILHVKIQDNCKSIKASHSMCDYLKKTDLNSLQLLQVDGVVDDSSCSDTCSSIDESDVSSVDDEVEFLVHQPFSEFHHFRKQYYHSKIPQFDGTIDINGVSENEENPVQCCRCHRTYRTNISYQRHLSNCSAEYMSSSSESDYGDDEKQSSMHDQSFESVCSEVSNSIQVSEINLVNDVIVTTPCSTNNTGNTNSINENASSSNPRAEFLNNVPVSDLTILNQSDSSASLVITSRDCPDASLNPNQMDTMSQQIAINKFSPQVSSNAVSSIIQSSCAETTQYLNCINGKGRPVKTYSNRKKTDSHLQPIHYSNSLIYHSPQSARQIIEYQPQPSCRAPVPAPTLFLQQVPSASINISPFLQPVTTTPNVQYVTAIDSSETPQYIATPDPMNPGTFRIQQSSVIQSIIPQVVGTIIQPPVEQIVTVNPQTSNIDFYTSQNTNSGVYLSSQPTVIGLETVMNNSVMCNTVMNNSILNNSMINNPVLNNSMINNSPLLSNTVINSPVLNNTVITNPNIVANSYQTLTTHLLQASKPQVETARYVIVNTQPNVNECQLAPSSGSSVRTSQISQPNNWSINKHICKTTKEVTTMYHSNAELLPDHSLSSQVNCVKVVKKKTTEETMIETASINNAFCNKTSSLPSNENNSQANNEVINLTKLVNDIPAMFDSQHLCSPPKPISPPADLLIFNEPISISSTSDVQMKDSSLTSVPVVSWSKEKTSVDGDSVNQLHETSIKSKVEEHSSSDSKTVESINSEQNIVENICDERPVSPFYSVSKVFSTSLNSASHKTYPGKTHTSTVASKESKSPIKNKTVSSDNVVNSRILKPTNKNGNIENKYGGNKTKNGSTISKNKPFNKNGKKCSAPKVVFEINSEDGFSYSTTSLSDAWQKVFEAVQHARAIRKLPLLPHNPFKNAEASLRTLGLDNNGLKYLLEQLPGVGRCTKYKPTYHKSKVSQVKNDLKENKSGCARSEPFSTRKEKYDMFSWLASRHRRPPKLLVASDADLINGNRRATSLNLPMAMRFRHLRETSKEAVGVFRSDIHGRGLFCLRDIDAGEMVIEYAGEVIRAALTDKRENFYNSKGIGCYMFRIDDYYVVDATLKGNAARFINHSCEPNCYSRIVDILGKKHILIFAQRRIPQGEELTYDYKFPLEEDKISCHCLSRKCRKYLN